jgi:hypothetical protein
MSARINVSGMLAALAGAVAASLTLPAAAGEVVDPHAAHPPAAAGEPGAQGRIAGGRALGRQLRAARYHPGTR